MIAELQALHAGGELGSSSALIEAGHNDLVSAAQRYAGSWARAVRLAGVAYEPPRRWTDALVLREIQRLHRQGKSLAATRVDNSLVIAATRRFGTWREARARALPSHVAPYESWTKRKLLDAIAALHREGVSLSAMRVRQLGRGRLINAAVRLFGSWGVACERAVPGEKRIRQPWTPDRLLRAIRARHRKGLSLSATAIYAEESSWMAPARRYFGSWPAARSAAGVSYKDPRRTWSRRRVVAELRRRAPSRSRPTISQVGQALYKVAVARFGDFERACRAAGLRG